MYQPNQSNHPPSQDLDQSTEDPSPPRRRNFAGQLSVPQLPGAMERVSRQRLEELEYSNHLGHTQQTLNPYPGADPASRPRYQDTSRHWPGQPQSDFSSQHPQHYQFAPHYGPPGHHASHPPGTPLASPLSSATQYAGPGIAGAPNSTSRAVFSYGGPTGVRSPKPVMPVGSGKSAAPSFSRMIRPPSMHSQLLRNYACAVPALTFLAFGKTNGGARPGQGKGLRILLTAFPNNPCLSTLPLRTHKCMRPRIPL
ncbi:hypothetical protein BS47DRAFT_1030799 [Hydnum rufescens UP504]|uniref:Uncharacterized protein n=1 Tax=Hydnum rufescens UP504 TaxID=1448309 RepID=A0A9P6AWM7_9AGAM|nr:hypothetical protein BS47DRAFT_1030799 [Hydnum rufescens UP504]